MTLYVDDLLGDVAYDAYRAYDQAAGEAQRLLAEAERDDPEPDDTQFVWWYDRDDAGAFIARDPAVPAWSWEAWREQPSRPGAALSPEYLAMVEDSLRTGSGLYSGLPGDVTSAYIAKSREIAEELWRLEDERDARIEPIAALEEDLETQRRNEWHTYGEALKAKVEELAAETPGLNVPVHITVDVGTINPPGDSPLGWPSLQGRLLETAVEQTPTPADLPGTPLSRLRPKTLTGGLLRDRVVA